jgi:hypothetical protein
MKIKVNDFLCNKFDIFRVGTLARNKDVATYKSFRRKTAIRIRPIGTWRRDKPHTKKRITIISSLFISSLMIPAGGTP